MRRVLLSAYRCDPNGVSEAYSGFRTALALAERHHVTLCTPSFNAQRVADWRDRSGVKSSLTVLSVPMSDWDSRLGVLGSAAKPGFYLYEQRLLSLCRSELALADFDLVWHRTPVSFRFRTRLHTLGLPLIIGPVSGGLRPPPELADYFRGEGVLYRLRGLDPLLLGSSSWMKPFDEAALVLVSGEYVRDLLPARLLGKETVLLETGIDLADPPAETMRGRGFEVLFVGKLLRYKGPLIALEAFADFLEGAGRPGDARLTIVGEGAERSGLERAARELGISSVVDLTGRLSRDETLARYDDADVFLFPAVTEAAGNVYLEAMAAGLPLVVVASGGGASIPCDEAAFKIAVNDRESMVRDLSHALASLYADRPRRARMGSAGRECVRDNYSWPTLAERMWREVDRVADRGIVNGLAGGGQKWHGRDKDGGVA